MIPDSSLLFILVGLLILSAFFAATEAALIAINKVRLRHLVQDKKPGARRVYALVARMDKLIATMIIGNSLVNVATASISMVLFSAYFGEQRALWLSTVSVTLVLIVFGELAPKVLATNRPETVAFAFRHLASFFIWIFSPLTWFLTWVSHGVILLLGGNPHARSPLVTEEEIKMMITIGKEEGFYGDHQRKMLERIFHFDEIEVRDVMTPIEKMTALPLNVEDAELERVLMEEGHNRIPVYQEKKENVIGILYVRDLLYLFLEGSLIRLGDVICTPYFVTTTKKVGELLKEFQSRKIQIAIVKDAKSQKTVGLVTLEDLIEEIVGELEDKGMEAV